MKLYNVSHMIHSDPQNKLYTNTPFHQLYGIRVVADMFCQKEILIRYYYTTNI